MPCTDLKQLHGELVELIEKQIETLAKQACDKLTDVEFLEYNDRKKRIDELYETLRQLDSAA
jgi:hypothetical protein